jgi:hypothetical protein
MLRNELEAPVDEVVEGVDVVVVDGDEPVLRWQPRPGCANAASLTTGEGSGAMLPGCVVVDVGSDVVVVGPDVCTVVVVALATDVVVDAVAECDGGSYFSWNPTTTRAVTHSPRMIRRDQLGSLSPRLKSFAISLGW